jgi:hypothetical protein
MRRTAPAAALALLAAVVAMTGVLTPRTARAAGELETRTISTYEIRADGSVHVSITAQVTNLDPSTQRRTSGRVLFYSAVAFAVHEAAENLTARSGTTRLVTESTGAARGSDDPFRLIAVRFNRDLYYNESLPITLDYELSDVRGAQMLVNAQYAFVPAVGQGTYSIVQITVPSDRALTIGSANCARTAQNPLTYICGASTTAGDYNAGGRCAFAPANPRWDCAFTSSDYVVIPFEATAPGLAMASRSASVTLAQTTVEVRVSYFTGDEAWAARIEDLVRRGLPILEEANGYNYPGLPLIEIVESGYRDTHGYEGLANSLGRLRVTPVADDRTVLHEVSHLWSGIFASRWLAEGMADFTANVTARKLGLRVEPARRPIPPGPVLEEWGALRSQIAISSADRELEESGYARSLRFIEILAERIGERTLATVNATIAQERLRATARSYLDVLEDVTGASYSQLFADWALTGPDIDLLPARENARAQAAQLQERIEQAGLSRPLDLTQALRAWDFDRVLRLSNTANEALNLHMDTASRSDAAGLSTGDRFASTFAESAEAAMGVAGSEAESVEAVRSASDRLDAKRHPIMRVGLLGRDLAADEAASRDALARGEYQLALDRAQSLQRNLDTAGRDGAIRITVVGVALLLVLGLFVVRGRSRSRGGAGTRRTGARQAEHRH